MRWWGNFPIFDGSFIFLPMEMDVQVPAPERPSGRSTGSSAVPRLSGSEAKEYLQARVLPEHPVIFTDVMDGVPAMTKWRPSFFESNYPDLTVVVDDRRVTMREQLLHIMESTEERPSPYPFNFSIPDKTPGLMKDLVPFVSFGRSDRTVHPWMPHMLTGGTIVHELFFGGRGAAFPRLHYDLLGMNTQITQVMGDKEFFFFAPSEAPYLYPSTVSPRVSTLNSIFTPDLGRFPLFRHATPLRVMLHEGETLYFPAGWWHITRIPGPSITYGRAVVNASNWNLMMREDLYRWRKQHPVFALPAFVFGKALGSLFDAVESLG
jgi:hypothetical protein